MRMLRETLQKEGLRYTQQRRDIWNELRSSDKHRNAEEIFFTLRRRELNISRATVYRTIDVLVKYKLIEKLDIGDGRARFEYSEKYIHHDHLVCTKCGKIVEFYSNEIEELQYGIAKQHNFKILDNSHRLFGICKDCN